MFTLLALAPLLITAVIVTVWCIHDRLTNDGAWGYGPNAKIRRAALALESEPSSFGNVTLHDLPRGNANMTLRGW